MLIMLSVKKKIVILTFLMLFFFGAVIHLMLLRHKTGDIYPPYSSLRSDPLGIKIFFESLKGMRGLKVLRNYRPLEKIKYSKEFTLFYPGVYHKTVMPYDDMYKTLEDIIKKGNRVVLTFFPVSDTDRVSYEKDDDYSDSNAGSEGASKDSSSKSSDNRFKIFSERLGFDFQVDPKGTKPFADCAACEKSDELLPKSVIMPTALFFDNPDDSWRVIYTMSGKAVLMEKVIGKGSIVLCADSFLLSNEAMVKYRYPELLAWLVGSKREVIFDEKHHGIEETQGIATLARKYRLHGLFACFFVLAGLFIWQNAFPLIPRRNTIHEAEISMQQDPTQGLIYLLRRSIPSSEILNVSFQEWKKSNVIISTQSQNHTQEIIRIIESANLKDEQSLLKAYKQIHMVLNAQKLVIKK